MEAYDKQIDRLVFASLVLTKNNSQLLLVKFYLGQSERYNLGYSLLDSSEESLQRGGGKSVHM